MASLGNERNPVMTSGGHESAENIVNAMCAPTGHNWNFVGNPGAVRALPGVECSLSADPQSRAFSDGRLRMCPPGGSSFTMAWSMACTMRRKRDVGQKKLFCKFTAAFS